MNRTVITILFFLILVTSCRKDNGTPAFTENSYPLAVGDWWQYQLLDIYGGGGYDTFTLNVISKTNVGPYVEYKCNAVLNGAVWDTGYFLQSDTSLSFVNMSIAPDYSSFPNFHLKFPISKGQKWQEAFPGDTTVVLGVENSYSSYGHTYGPCYSTVESYNLPHNFKVNSMLLTPKIGLIYQSIDFNSDTAEPLYGIPGVQINQSITLLNYHVQ